MIRSSNWSSVTATTIIGSWIAKPPTPPNWQQPFMNPPQEDILKYGPPNPDYNSMAVTSLMVQWPESTKRNTTTGLPSHWKPSTIRIVLTNRHSRQQPSYPEILTNIYASIKSMYNENHKTFICRSSTNRTDANGVSVSHRQYPANTPLAPS